MARDRDVESKQQYLLGLLRDPEGLKGFLANPIEEAGKKGVTFDKAELEVILTSDLITAQIAEAARRVTPALPNALAGTFSRDYSPWKDHYSKEGRTAIDLDKLVNPVIKEASSPTAAPITVITKEQK